MELGASPQYATSILEAMDNDSHGASLTGSAILPPPPRTAASPGEAADDPSTSPTEAKPQATKPKTGDERVSKKARAPKPEAYGGSNFFKPFIFYFLVSFVTVD